MTRSIVLIASLFVALFVVPAVAAQEASPAATPGAMAGVLVEPLGVLEVLPGMAVPVVRVELAPGAALPPHTSPGPAVAQVDSGQVDYVVITGAANRARMTVLTPAGTPAAATPGMEIGTPEANGTPAAAMIEAVALVEEELILVGEETPLAAGEGVAFGPDVVHSFHNTGTEPAVLVIVGEFPPDQPPFRFQEADATPAATPAS